jgi:hypothetical protein
MRILATAFLVTLCFASSARAQGLEKGVRAGINFTKTATSGEGAEDALDWQLRGVFGGFVTWRFTSWIDLQPEVLYAMKGARTDAVVEAKLLLDYLEMPVLARVTRGATGGTRYYVAGGPSVSILLRARTRADFGGSIEEIDLKEDLERVDVGLVAAGGVEFGSIVVDGRYTHGFTNIDKESGGGQKVRNRAVSVTVGIRF